MRIVTRKSVYPGKWMASAFGEDGILEATAHGDTAADADALLERKLKQPERGYPEQIRLLEGQLIWNAQVAVLMLVVAYVAGIRTGVMWADGKAAERC